VCDSGCEVKVVKEAAGLQAFEVDDDVVEETNLDAYERSFLN